MSNTLRKNNNTFYKTQVSDKSRLIEVEIGDSKQDEFYPQIKSLHWDNDANFSVRLSDCEGGIASEKDGKIEWVKGKKTSRIYEIDIDEDGGFEFEVELSEKPSSNVIEYTIQSKNFDFFYQPALTEEQLEVENVRPDNIIGSYAVYHKTRKNNRVGGKAYRTGKAFHIYRPFVEDADNNRVWCDLDINDGLMIITIPQKFLDEATYPIVIDPTFGYTSVGGSVTTVARNSYCGGKNVTRTGTPATLSSAATSIDSLHAYIKSNGWSGTVTTVVMLNVDGGGDPGNHPLEVSSEEEISYTSTPGWETFDTGLPSGAVDADDYLFSISADPTDIPEDLVEDVNVYYDSTEIDGRYIETFYDDSTCYSDSQEDPWTPPINIYNNNIHSIYATYSSDALPIQINIGDSWKDVESIQINIGDTWKDVTEAKINIGDTWKDIF